MKYLGDLWRGISSRPWKLAEYTFAGFSVVLTILRGIAYFIPVIKFEGFGSLATAIGIGVIFGVRKAWKPSRIEIPLANCDTVIEIVFGDLFTQDGIRVIAVSEFFDSKLGMPVSNKSLHGMFLEKCFGGHPESFDKQVDEQLKNIRGREVAKSEGKSICYPIGSTALITVNEDRYLAFALTRADHETCKVSSNVTTLWEALDALWQRARIESNGDAVNLPLIGSGLAGLNLPTRDLLDLLILSAITESRIKQVTQRIRIVLYRARFGELNLNDVKEHWTR
jgi:Thoeris protein ThsA, Macro domain